MTNQHPITPSPELVQQWYERKTIYFEDLILAAQWGADQELEACCAFAQNHSWGLVNGPHVESAIRAARRPKPPSLKEQALLALSHLVKGADESMDTTEAAEYIRRALEQLDD